MYFHPLKALVTVAAFAAATTAFSSQSHAFSIRFDCHSPDVPSWAKSSDLVTISTRIDGTWYPMCSMVPSDCSTPSSLPLCNVPGFAKESLSGVRLTINGDDTFWLDRFIVYDAAGSKSIGGNDYLGWCLSTDPADGNSPYCIGAATVPTRAWPVVW